jgi:hypothetical protein
LRASWRLCGCSCICICGGVIVRKLSRLVKSKFEAAREEAGFRWWWKKRKMDVGAKWVERSVSVLVLLPKELFFLTRLLGRKVNCFTL